MSKEDAQVPRRVNHQQAEQRDNPDNRVRRRSQNTDPFHIDPEEIPFGTSWEWKRKSTYGEEDQEHLTQMQEAGWLPVRWEQRPEHKRPPAQTPVGLKEPVVRRGMVLMERPIEFTMEAQMEDRQAAEEQVADKMRQLGQAPPDTGPRRLVDVKRSYGPAGIKVPNE